MHYITYTDYHGRSQTIKIPAVDFDEVIFFTGQLRRSGIEFTHYFED